MGFDAATQKNIDSWLGGHYEEKIKQEIQRLAKDNPKELQNAFFKKLSFGTGGARAMMGIGTNRLNNYTIRALSHALALYLKKSFPQTKPSVLIGFDNRNHSKEFALETACTLAASGIKVYLFKELRPTPLVSFGCRYKKCQAAVMITASHNPPEYNGYKVYWQGGAQILTPHDKNILLELEKIKDPSTIQLASPNDQLIERVLEEIDNAYLKELQSVNNYPEMIKKEGSKLKIIYTNLHGTGITLLPKALKDFGFTTLDLVEKQATIDGNFTFAPLPNPEEEKALEMGIQEMKAKKYDLLLATDPDADRIAAVAMHQDQAVIFSGNQIAALLVYHLLETLSKQNKLPTNSFCIKTIVTTELFKAITAAFKVECCNVLTGFKYIAEKIARLEGQRPFILGAEESLGYLYKDFVRDKDSISAAFLISEMALIAKLEGKTLFDLLEKLYQTYGLYREKLFSIKFAEGQEGLEQMQKTMQKLRSNPPSKINQIPIVVSEDYISSQKDNLKLKTSTFLTLPKSNVLSFWLDDESKIVIRPSGTEPKIKVYLGVKEAADKKNLKQKIASADQKLELLEKSVKQTLLKN